MSRTHGFMSRTPLLNKKTAFHRLFLHYKINSNAEWRLFFNGRYTKNGDAYQSLWNQYLKSNFDIDLIRKNPSNTERN